MAVLFPPSPYAGTSLPVEDNTYHAGTNWNWMEDAINALFSCKAGPEQYQYVEHTIGAKFPPKYRANYKPKCNGTNVRKDGRFA